MYSKILAHPPSHLITKLNFLTKFDKVMFYQKYSVPSQSLLPVIVLLSYRKPYVTFWGKSFSRLTLTKTKGHPRANPATSL